MKRCLASVLTFFIKIWTKTLRIEISRSDLELLQIYRHSAKICALWHNRLFVASELFKRYFQGTKMYGLISPSKDGAWLAEIYGNIGIHAIRGSAKRGGQAALVSMTEILKRGHTITITPDGPRGPKYVAKAGIATLAKETKVPVILGGIKIQNAWRFNSWDRFYLPKPFSRIDVHLHVITPETYAFQTTKQLLRHIGNKLYKINAKRYQPYCPIGHFRS
jgi:lysophospholipid acyltransferase (LPLAT)-like uncharacterized protein